MTGSGEADLFAVLGVPRRQDLAPGELERQFHERSRAVHPDRFARATPAERRAALERSTQLNHAYRTLRDPWRRAEHLLSLLGDEVMVDAVPPAGEGGDDAAFLEEQLHAREALASARRQRDVPVIEALHRAADRALSALERELGDVLRGAPGRDEVARARRLLARVRYHQALAAEADRALDHVRGVGLP